MIVFHGNTVIDSHRLSDGAVCLCHRIDPHAHLLERLYRLQDLWGGSRLGRGEHHGITRHGLTAHHVELCSMEERYLMVCVGILVHDILHAQKLIPSAADAQQEEVVKPLVANVIRELLHLLSDFVELLAVLEITLLVEVNNLDLLGLLHKLSSALTRSPLVSIDYMCALFVTI